MCQNMIIRAIIDRTISLIFEDTSADPLELHTSWQTLNNFLQKEMFSLSWKSFSTPQMIVLSKKFSNDGQMFPWYNI